MKKEKVSVVMAAWNEAGNVEELAKRFYSVFEKMSLPFEIIYVLRGTKKESGYDGLMKLKAKGMDKIRIIYKPDLIGYAPSFKAGFGAVAKDANYILTLDADLNHQPEEFPGFWKKIHDGKYDLVVGSRYIEGGKFAMPMWKKTLSRLMNVILSILYGLPVKDKTSGYRLYRKELVKKIVPMTTSRNFEFLPETLICAERNGYKIAETPIDFRARQRGVSKMHIMNSIKGYLRLLIRSFQIKRK